MTRLEHGHGGPHAYVVAGETDPHVGPLTVGHGHGGAHAYVTASRRTAAGPPPGHESLHKILTTFRFADAPSWSEVKKNYHLDELARHPDREDIRRNGIREPIAIDYEQDPPEVVDGHTRLIHAEALGLQHVPVKNTTFADHHYYSSRRTAGAVSVPWGFHREHPETWGEDYHHYARENPHAAAIGQAQDHLRLHVPAYETALPDSEHEAGQSLQHMLRRGGHPRADEAFVVRHRDPRRGSSNVVYDPDDHEIPGVALHPTRWDYGTLAHEAAHILHHHEIGRKPNEATADDVMHGPDFVRHFKATLVGVHKRAPEELEKAYGDALERIQRATGGQQRTAGAVDPRAHEVGPGHEWRQALPPEHEDVVRHWEKHSPSMTTGERATLRKVLKDAPSIDGPVYRGVTPKNTYGFVDKIKASHKPGQKIKFSKYVSTTTRPEVAAGYGHVVYEIHDSGARAIGNRLHEAVAPPGEYTVHSVDWNDQTPARSNTDERTTYDSPRLHVVLHPAQQRTAAAKNQPVCPSCRDWVSYAVPGGWEHVNGTPMCPQVGSGTCSCCGGTGEHLCGHECYACDASGEHESDQPCPGHHGTVDDRPGHSPAERVHIEATLSRLAFLPTKRLFGPTYGLDTRLFDGDHLKPDVRRYIYETLADFWKPKHGVGWDDWAIIYLAGSEASEWTSEERIGNNDFDVLIGVDYDAYRKNRSRTDPAQQQTDQEITDELNADFKRLNEQTAQAYIPIDGKLEGPFSNTWYVNPDSYDIRKIKPYAAYDVTHDRWAVKPPHLPKWDISQFPEGPALVAEAEAVSAYVRAILQLPEPYRTQQGYALWHHLHSDRSRAFSDQGEGWYDPGNVIEKWLDQEGLWEKLVEIMVRVKNDPSTVNAPGDWSNTPVVR